ncbi:MAG: toxin-antitoxin system HicB family antitoxin [Planctomycetia bacterium]|nr:toxin-antitoxin system HicB family antitoxin [Planctomycetia bacterium]
MKTLTLEIADSHYLYAERLAASLNEPLTQLLHRALIEKLDEIGTAHTQERAKRGSREAFRAALSKVPDVPPDAGDELD